ncbi:hypothetical protein EOL94_00295 [bacterium]|nr:hypothetical protein [bacterium]
MNDDNFTSFANILQNKKTIKPPAYPWQELALQIIKDLAVPANKKSSVFKVCKDNSESSVRHALIDTKELCKEGDKWQYFFKVINNYKKSK